MHALTSEAEDQDNLYPCASIYYSAIQPGNSTAESFWSIKNEGDQMLNLQLPLIVTGASDRFSIITQPDKNTLHPGEETVFKVMYNGKDGGMATITINSNDPVHPNCDLILDGGTIFSGADIIWTGDGDGSSWEDSSSSHFGNKILLSLKPIAIRLGAVL